MHALKLAVAASAFALMTSTATAENIDIQAFFADAGAAERAGMAQKTKAVEARPAVLGEVVVTIIPDEGEETQSKPAEAGDMVVRNRCTVDDGMYLVKADKFAERYGEALSEADGEGWRRYEPVGKPMRFVILRADEGPFSFLAPWGEAMAAKPGDAIVQDPEDPADTYRIARYAFDCTYEITEQAKAE